MSLYSTWDRSWSGCLSLVGNFRIQLFEDNSVVSNLIGVTCSTLESKFLQCGRRDLKQKLVAMKLAMTMTNGGTPHHTRTLQSAETPHFFTSPSRKTSPTFAYESWRDPSCWRRILADFWQLAQSLGTLNAPSTNFQSIQIAKEGGATFCTGPRFDITDLQK